MNILRTNINDGLTRKEKQREKGKLLIEQENCVGKKNEKNDEELCTILVKGGNNMKETKSLYFMTQNIDYKNDATKNNEKLPTNQDFSPFTAPPPSSSSSHMNTKHALEKIL
jgi:hypothetical protein